MSKTPRALADAAALAAQFRSDPAVRPGRNAGSLTVRGKVFAMTVKGELVLKLPKPRIAALLSAGRARPYEMGGRVMGEWAVIAADGDVSALAAEARAFVAATT